MKLRNIRKLGRYINPTTGTEVNIHQGRQVGRSVDVLFWFKSGVRQFVSDREFYSDPKWAKVMSPETTQKFKERLELIK